MKTLNNIRYAIIRMINHRKTVKLSIDQASTIKPGDVILIAHTNGEKSFLSIGKGRFIPMKTPRVKVQGSFTLRDILL